MSAPQTLSTEAVRDYLLALQNRLCDGLAAFEPGKMFDTDSWARDSNAEHQGGGITRVLSNGVVFERAGVNFSDVHGGNLPPAATAQRPELIGRAFRAMGVSLVCHPRNPYAPTAHMNVRFFVAEKPGADPVWWFGGGFDLTPYYGFVDDCVHWQQNAQQACAGFGEGDETDVYTRYKAACDNYFFIKHRNEPRGIGGLFFDDLNRWGFDTSFAFTRSIGDHFLSGYIPIIARRKDKPYGEAQRNWQLYRRGRYVEFNLVQDRGTLFGLQSGGRTESILMSMPPLVQWEYRREPAAGSPEATLLSDFLQPKDWLATASSA